MPGSRTYTLRCCYSGKTHEVHHLSEDDLAPALSTSAQDSIWQSMAETLGKRRGDRFIDASGSETGAPLEWPDGTATELHVGPWRDYGAPEELFDRCNALLARANRPELTLLENENGQPDWEKTFSLDDVNGRYLETLDRADWELVEEQLVEEQG